MKVLITRALGGMARHVIAALLRIPGVLNAKSFAQWERAGYHVVPVGFYYPVPDTRVLRAHYPGASALVGVDFNLDAQRQFLLEALAKYADECRFPHDAPDDETFGLDNTMFVGTDPHLYYCMIRHFRPARIIEVGAGFSTLLAADAVARNGHGQIMTVEPYPRPFIARGARGIVNRAQKAEDVPLDFFDQLESGDILFIDSSHVVRTGGDVTRLILDVLPRLKPGVIVHIHDIFLPDDYPPEWPLDKRWFWTEQYLVHAYLLHNARAEVLIASHALAGAHRDDLRRVFPEALWHGGGSLWLRLR